jgi:hypothetical protein
MKKTTIGLTLIALTGATQLCPAQSLPQVRQLGPVTSVAKEPLGSVSSVRALPDGRVLINDIVGRRVLMFDSTLSTATVVADTTSATASAYGTRPGGLIAFRGDSTLFVDPASLSMLLIDPNGKISRVMSAPRANDVGFLVGGPFGNPGFDAQGRLVYRAPPNFAAFRPPQGGGGNRLPQFPTFPDTAALVRYDLATRKVDTVTFFKTPTVKMNVTQSPDGGVRVTSTMNPLPQGDDWALMSDGTIALVRTKDFHVDWLNADGTVTASPKIPFQWERLTDEGKVAFLDSAKVAIEKARASGQFGAFGGGGPQLVVRGPGGDGAPAGTRRDGAGADAQRTGTAPAPAPNAQPGTMTVTAGGNTAVTAVGAGGGGAGGQLPPLVMVQPSELPDYKPAFTPGATRADVEGNLWIRTSQNVDARPVYDVINRKGELIDRVQLPANRVLVGFGSGGVVYLAVRDGTTAHLEKARVR